MEDMEKKNEKQEGEELALKRKQDELIQGLMKEKDDMKTKLKTAKKAARERVNSGSGEEKKEPRSEMMSKIFNQKRPARNQQVDELAINEDMLKLLGDICTED